MDEALTPAVFHILLALLDRKKHGYGIMLEVADATQGRFVMGPGTLYGTLKRMLAAGLIAEAGEKCDPDAGKERRRYYRITTHGRAAAQAEAARIEALGRAAVAKRLLKARGFMIGAIS